MRRARVHMGHVFAEFIEVLWRRGGKKCGGSDEFDPQNLAESTVGDPLVRVSV